MQDHNIRINNDTAQDDSYQTLQTLAERAAGNRHDALRLAGWMSGLTYLPSYRHLTRGEAQAAIARLEDSPAAITALWRDATTRPDPTLEELLR